MKMNEFYIEGSDNQCFLEEIERNYGKDVRDEIWYRQVYRRIAPYMQGQLWHDTDIVCNSAVKINRTIWVLWLQGMERTPLLIRKCYESLKKNCPSSYNIVFLDASNLEEYVHLPPHIVEKYYQGFISRTHFSDLVRLELLYRYGGCWSDATVYYSEPIPEHFLEWPIFFFQRRFSVSVIKGSSWWIYAKKAEIIIRETRRVLFNYWVKNDVLWEYFLIHIVMSRVIDTYPDAQADYFAMPYFGNENPHVFSGQLGQEYSAERWNIIKEISKIHKLTYKTRFLYGDIYNFYTALVENKL